MIKLNAASTGWALAVVLAVTTVIGVIFHVQPSQSVIDQLKAEAKKAELVTQLRLALLTATEAEKSAVLATTDEASITFADRARASTATADATRAVLESLLTARGTPAERAALARFGEAFAEFKRVDAELLSLAVKNTNLKASALAAGDAAEAMAQLDAALSRLIARAGAAPGDRWRRIILLAAGAQAEALRIHALLPVHIAEESEHKMDELERVMAERDRAVRGAMKALATAVPAGDPELAAAVEGYARFAEVQSKIVALSRENTNVRSLAISLNEKRKVTVLCEEALAALGQAIDETLPGGSAAPRPRR